MVLPSLPHISQVGSAASRRLRAFLKAVALRAWLLRGVLAGMVCVLCSVRDRPASAAPRGLAYAVRVQACGSQSPRCLGQ